jgi:hypothetical protein
MRTILKFITPLSVLSVWALLYALDCMIFSDAHGWLALSGISLIIALAIPSLIANVVINMIIKRKKINLLIQLLIAVIIIVWYCEEYGSLGMPLINDFN